MAGFITHYLFGIETCEQISDNYIHQVIKDNIHAFLIGLQGSDLFSFDPHTLPKNSLSCRSTDVSIPNQEYAAFFNHMMDHIGTLQDGERDICIAYLAGFLCYFVIEQCTEPYIAYRTFQDIPIRCNSRRLRCHKQDIETTLDTILLRSHCHIEPSQLNFEALTFANRKEQSAINRLIRYTIFATYHHRSTAIEITSGLRSLRRQNTYPTPSARIKRTWCNSLVKAVPSLPLSHTRIYEDYGIDQMDYMNSEHKSWYIHPDSPEPVNISFEEIFIKAIHSSRELLENLDSWLSWGMDRDTLINSIMQLAPIDE